MLKTALLFVCASAAMVTGLGIALAEPASAGFKGCYERVYDAKYLRRHKGQHVIRIRLQIGVSQGDDGPFEFLDRIDAVLRKARRYDGNLISCEPMGEELSCGIEADGGTFTVTDRGLDRGRQAIRISNDGYMNFGGDDASKTVESDNENREFRLYRVSEGPCP